MERITEVAVSLHYKYRPNEPGYVFDGRTGAKLDKEDVQTKIAIYEDRVVGWFFEHAERLLEKGDAGYPILQVAVSQVEGVQQYRDGKSSKNASKKTFRRAMRRLFPALKGGDALLDSLYTDVRCGLFHDGFTKGPVYISESFAQPISLVDWRLEISPGKFLQAVKGDFLAYIGQLREAQDKNLLDNFERMWDEGWRASKEKLTRLALASTQ